MPAGSSGLHVREHLGSERQALLAVPWQNMSGRVGTYARRDGIRPIGRGELAARGSQERVPGAQFVLAQPHEPAHQSLEVVRLGLPDGPHIQRAAGEHM